MKIKISADSTCDLSEELIAQYDIGIVPLIVVKDGVPHSDGIDITPQDIFDYVDSGAGICHTAAVNVVDYQKIFTDYLTEYDAVIHLNISNAFSCCYQNASIAATELENVYVVDSLNLSTGSGHLVLDAAIMAGQGMLPGDIAAKLSEMTGKVESSFVINTLKYLHKGGRCSSVAALGANVLKLKPCIEVIDGKMTVGKKYRGNIDKAILQYVRDRLNGRDDIDTRRIFVTYTIGTPDTIVKSVKEEIAKYFTFDEMLETTAGCTISNHCGPCTLGILFYRK